jgi:putative sterol carrier protein
MALNTDLHIAFDVYNWKGIWEKVGDINHTKACMTNTETSH